MVKTLNVFANGRYGKNDVLKDACQGLADGELIKAFRTSDILKKYRVKDASILHTTSVEWLQIMRLAAKI